MKTLNLANLVYINVCSLKWYEQMLINITIILNPSIYSKCNNIV